jgi:pimeloyl-ACP methyl ester carboxylesterase
MDIILIAGLWLQRSAWAEVVDELASLGHRAVAVALPGVDDDTLDTATLDDQVAAVVAAVDAAQRPLVVGHSAASTLAWLAADRRSQAVAAVAMVGGFPTADGGEYAPFHDLVDGVMPFPGWEPFEGPDSDDLSAEIKAALAAAAVPVPGAVAQGVVHYTDPRRAEVPVTLVCPEYSPEQAKAWFDDGGMPELTTVTHLAYVDIDSGHWPMASKPAVFAALLAGLADAAAPGA